ncbi:DUF3631 domain-containing protein [Allonocardiopsis opalescens]|uniref:Uncharacterized protein DUF3631 n=1 Tax=Allonocardiopsis opalescens TaxID=1144618 RepID=A0A2T0Q9Z6_9ACTN|nr:DUF3631 domain-containing protein [Allonocardiopsis opalescens]PRY00698.1 uncharacterized protein DUF3631 [Allonocardiopsis opalescens]
MNLDDLDQGDTLAGLLDEVHAAFTRYVVLPSPEAADAVVLWCAATHAQTVADNAPRLVVKAPEKRCGKSRCLDIVESISFKPIVAVNATPAAIFRSIEAEEPPTLIFDEADTIFPARGGKVAEQNEELRGLLNAGHQRGRPARRVVGKGTEQFVAEFPTFAMAALAGIGSMPDTIEDRAVVITMRRRAPGEKVDKFRYRRDQLPLHELRDRLSDCVRANLDELGQAEPNMPVEDRAADTWEPLIALADVAGGSWPKRARQAAKALTDAHEQADTGSSTGVRLLADCRAVFTAKGDPNAIKTTDLLNGLKAIEEAPWAEWGKNGLTARKLGDFLREYDITSSNIDFAPGRIDRAKGYLRLKFADAWSRYCAPAADTAPSNGDGEPYHPYQAHPPSSAQVRNEGVVRNDPYQETIRTTPTSTDDGGTGGTEHVDELAECAVSGCTNAPRRACHTCADHMEHETAMRRQARERSEAA